MASLKMLLPQAITSLEFNAVDDATRASVLKIVQDVKENGAQGLLRQGRRLGDVPKDAGDDYQFIVGKDGGLGEWMEEKGGGGRERKRERGLTAHQMHVQWPRPRESVPQSRKGAQGAAREDRAEDSAVSRNVGGGERGGGGGGERRRRRSQGACTER